MRLSMKETGWYYYIIKNLIEREWGCRIVPELNKRGITCVHYNYGKIKHFAGKSIVPLEDTNRLIADKIRQDVPFMVGRFGGTELNTIVSVLRSKKFPYIDRREYYLDRMYTGAGFFPKDIELEERFVQLMLDCCKDIDLCGVWKLFMEDYIIKTYAEQTQITELGWLEPWNLRSASSAEVLPWTHALAGKKVLIVHPFEKSIRSQYEMNRDKIFERLYPAELILPEFELKIVKAVQSLGGNNEQGFNTWFDALEYMIEQCKQQDFDVAIIGCGAYGFPLASAIKRMGKCVIHLGGATQLMFGIKGKRWIEYYADMMNDYWIRPFKEDTPLEAADVEGGCYW